MIRSAIRFFTNTSVSQSRNTGFKIAGLPGRNHLEENYRKHFKPFRSGKAVTGFLVPAEWVGFLIPADSFGSKPGDTRLFHLEEEGNGVKGWNKK